MEVRFLAISVFLIKNIFGTSEVFNPMNQDYRYTDGIPISLQGYKLNGFNYKVFNLVTMIGCGQRCLAEFPKCVSYNYFVSIKEKFCELNTKGVSSAAEGIAGSLEQGPNSVFVQLQTDSMNYPMTCADHYKSGVRESGLYYIRDRDNQYYRVFCDFHSEAKKVWTLVYSASFKNRLLPALKSVPYFEDKALKENDPNWESYRLSLAHMQDISNRSTHWRITCNFPQDGLQYHDYVRAKIAEVNMLTYRGGGQCKRVEFIHVINHNCSDCTVGWWQDDGGVLHHDLTSNVCDFGSTSGVADSQDAFGLYQTFGINFRCTMSNSSSTNIWFGSNV